MSIEILDLTGMDIDQVVWSGEILRADFGSGYGAKAVVGTAGGLHRWTISSGCLMDDEKYGNLIDGVPRFQYYFEFFRAHTTGTDDVFIMEFRGKQYHACFSNPEATFDMFTIDLFGGQGIEIRQRRLRGVEYDDDGSIHVPDPPTIMFGAEDFGYIDGDGVLTSYF